MTRLVLMFISAIIAIVLLMALLLWSTTPSNAHDAPAGWAYGQDCCSTTDCAPATKAVHATDGGWKVDETGDIIPYNDNAIRDSKDGEFHVCKFFAPRNGRVLRCLYVPPSSY